MTTSVRYQDLGQTGKAVPTNSAREDLLPFKSMRQISREQFEYWHLPTRWVHLAGKGWVPDLSTVTYTPGVNGVQGDTGKPGFAPRDLSAVRLGMTRKGGVLIDRNDPKVGGDYVRMHATTKGIHHFADRFESYSILGGRLRKKVDEDGRNAWLLELVDAGVLGVMPPEVLEDKIEQLQGRLDQYEQTAGLNPTYVKRKITEIEKTIKAMRADHKKQFGAAK